MSRTFRIGLTGGIASGKSAVAARFAELGIPVIDADQVARDVVAPGTVGLAELCRVFGNGILRADGMLDRARMRACVFADPAARARLEGVLHPLIRSAMDRIAATAGGPYQIFVIPLLVETKAQATVDRVLVVDAPTTLQIKRLMARDDTTHGEAETMLAAQASREKRLAAADDIIVNDSDLSSLSDKVDLLHAKYNDLAEQRLRGPMR